MFLFQSISGALMLVVLTFGAERGLQGTVLRDVAGAKNRRSVLINDGTVALFYSLKRHHYKKAKTSFSITTTMRLEADWAGSLYSAT